MDHSSKFLTLCFSLFILLHHHRVAAQNSYTPTDVILLNCGSSVNQTSPDRRTWVADATTLSPNSSTLASSPAFIDPSVSHLPHLSTARLFLSNFTYSFPVSPGSKFLRLYFYPQTYSGRPASASFFTVFANGYTLLRNFSASLTVSAIRPPLVHLSKEFLISSGDHQLIDLSFEPNPNSYAFVNAIEIVSAPDNLYTRADGDINPYTVVGSTIQFSFSNTTSLETLYRLNVGGSDVPSVNDTGMFRAWRQDVPFAFNGGVVAKPPWNLTIRYTDEDTPPYTAPEIVYRTARVMGGVYRVNMNYNLSWYFPVDSGFTYLVRLHFCETQPEITKLTQRVFVIYINNQTADPQADVIHMAGRNGIPVRQDYVVSIPPGIHKQQDLWLALHPLVDAFNTPNYYDAILNGVEVFKLNSSYGNLAGPNPDPPEVLSPPTDSQTSRRSNGSKKIQPPIIAGISGGVAVLVCVAGLAVLFFVSRRRRNEKSRFGEEVSLWDPFSKSTTKSTKSRGSSLPSDLCHHFSLAEIKTATNNFDPPLIIGAGGFGKVYQGSVSIHGGAKPVAIKRLDPGSQQGAREFVTEIEMLSRLRHLHLVSLIGYCVDRKEMILVYDYMSRGTLRDHLYHTDNHNHNHNHNPPLPWNQRLEICIGAALGLQYLHTGAKHVIIHRDVKTTNILLDEKWVAKVSDFGLSRTGPTGESDKAHVSTVVKGSFGYLDPEYARCEQLTEKSDVYSFGVVLCEVICGRPPVMRTAESKRVSLVEWARRCYRDGTFDQIVDRNLKGEIAPECLKKYVGIAMRCLHNNGIERPSMSDVVGELEFVLQLQRTAEERIRVGGPQMEINGQDFEGKWFDESFTTGSRSGTGTEVGSETSFSVISSDTVLGSTAVFSEIKNPTGR